MFLLADDPGVVGSNEPTVGRLTFNLEGWILRFACYG